MTDAERAELVSLLRARKCDRPNCQVCSIQGRAADELERLAKRVAELESWISLEVDSVT